jgi:hypothetical protein
MLAVALFVVSPLTTATAFAAVSGTVSVADFGAKGDGIAEDTAAFQAAVDAGAGKTLVIPAGTYKLGKVTITHPMDVAGAGVANTKLVAKDYINDNVFEVADTNHVNFADFEIDGNRAHISGGKPCGINFDRVSDCLVARVNIHDCDKTGVCVYEGSTRIVVRDSAFANNENDIEFHKATYSQAVNNVCRNARTECIASYEEAYGPQVTGHNVMAYNKCYDSETGLSFQRSHNNDAHDNYVENCGWGLVIVGLRDDVNQNCYANTAENNTIVGGVRSTGTGILTDDRTYDATLTGNVVKDWPLGPMGPVRLQGRHSVFTGNQVLNAGQQCEISATGTVFSGNLISRSGKVGLLVTQNVSNVRIENNTIEYCNDLAIQTLAALKDSAIVGNVLHSNCRTASGPGVWANSGSIWTNVVFAENKLYDDQTTKTQGGVNVRAGSTVAVLANTISGNCNWPAASYGAVVDLKTAVTDGHSRWTCGVAGTPGYWVVSDPVVTPPTTVKPPSVGTTRYRTPIRRTREKLI